MWHLSIIGYDGRGLSQSLFGGRFLSMGGLPFQHRGDIFYSLFILYLVVAPAWDRGWRQRLTSGPFIDELSFR